MSLDDFLGARASRPHKDWHSFACLLDFDQPGTALVLPFVKGGGVRSARGWRGRARWQGQDAGGTPALPGDAVRLGGVRRLAGDFSQF